MKGFYVIYRGGFLDAEIRYYGKKASSEIKNPEINIVCKPQKAAIIPFIKIKALEKGEVTDE